MLEFYSLYPNGPEGIPLYCCKFNYTEFTRQATNDANILAVIFQAFSFKVSCVRRSLDNSGSYAQLCLPSTVFLFRLLHTPIIRIYLQVRGQLENKKSTDGCNYDRD
jgi:hypothetical protein